MGHRNTAQLLQGDERISSFLCLLNVILSALLPQHLLSPLTGSSTDRHSTILEKGRTLFINFSLIEVPRATAEFVFLLAASLPSIPPRTARLLWAVHSSPMGQRLHRGMVWRGSDAVLFSAVCFVEGHARLFLPVPQFPLNSEHIFASRLQNRGQQLVVPDCLGWTRLK